MKHPTLDYKQLEDIISMIPKGIPWIYVLYMYIFVTLKRNKGNRSKTSRDINMPIRSLKYKFGSMEVLGFDIPKYEPPKKK